MNFLVDTKVLLGRAAAGSMPAHLFARARRLRRQEGLRRRRLRGVHRLGGRQTGAFLSDAGVPRVGTACHDHPGPRIQRRIASRAAGVSRCPSVPVRLLRCRHDHDHCGAQRGATRRSRARAEGQSVPLHWLPRYRGRDPRHPFRRRGRAREGVRRELAQSVRRGDRHWARALHDGSGRREFGSPESTALATRACPHPQHRSQSGACYSGRRRGVHLGGRAAQALQHGDARGPPRRS